MRFIIRPLLQGNHFSQAVMIETFCSVEIPKQQKGVKIEFGMHPINTQGFGRKHGRIYPELEEIRILTRVFRFKYDGKYVPVKYHDETFKKVSEEYSIFLGLWIFPIIILSILLFGICGNRFHNVKLTQMNPNDDYTLIIDSS